MQRFTLQSKLLGPLVVVGYVALGGILTLASSDPPGPGMTRNPERLIVCGAAGVPGLGRAGLPRQQPER